MIELAKAVQDFIRKSNIQIFNEKKSHQLFLLRDYFKGEIIFFDCVDNKLVRRYLGAPFGKGKISKMK
jgi:hypothetical protein